MATAVPARQSRASRGPVRGAERDPWTSWVLAVATLGVHGAVLHYRTNRELRDFGLDVRPTMSVVAFFPGVLLVVPFLVTVHRTAARIAVAQETTGLRPSIRAARCTVTSPFALLHIPYQQSELNRAWRADAIQEEPT
jgi:hypothetical protein